MEHKSHRHAILNVITWLLLLGGVGVILGMVFGVVNQIKDFNGIIILIVGFLIGIGCLLAAYAIAAKNKYICPICGTKMIPMGEGTGTGNFEISEMTGGKDVVSEDRVVMHICPECKHVKLIKEKHTIATFR